MTSRTSRSCSAARRNGPRAAALVVAALTVVALVGCSGSGSTPTADTSGTTSITGGTTPTTSTNAKRDVLAAVQRSRKVRAASFTSQLRGDALGQQFDIEASGTLDQDRKVGSVHVKGKQGHTTQDITVRANGDTTYVKSPNLRDLANGKTWVAVPTSDASSAGIFDFENLTIMDAGLAFAGGSRFRAKGTTKLFGTSAVRYDAQISLDDAKAALSSRDADALETAFHITGTTSTVNGSVWIDGDGYVRKFVLHGDIGGASATDSGIGSGRGTLDAESTMTDIGRTVSVDAPAASDVATVDVDKLAEALGS